MAVLNKEEFLARLQSRIGEDTSDDALQFVEDMTDTFNDLEVRTTAPADTEDWKAKYEELDKTWRDKYKARFFEPQTSSDEALVEQKENVIADGEDRTFEDLFEEREG